MATSENNYARCKSLFSSPDKNEAGCLAIGGKMKIFKMNDYDWWMDTDIESAKKNYLDEYGYDVMKDELKIKELTEHELDHLKYIITDGRVSSESITFRERMNEIDQIPQIFASTEY